MPPSSFHSPSLILLFLFFFLLFSSSYISFRGEVGKSCCLPSGVWCVIFKERKWGPLFVLEKGLFDNVRLLPLGVCTCLVNWFCDMKFPPTVSLYFHLPTLTFSLPPLINLVKTCLSNSIVMLTLSQLERKRNGMRITVKTIIIIFIYLSYISPSRDRGVGSHHTMKWATVKNCKAKDRKGKKFSPLCP